MEESGFARSHVETEVRRRAVVTQETLLAVVRQLTGMDDTAVGVEAHFVDDKGRKAGPRIDLERLGLLVEWKEAPQ